MPLAVRTRTSTIRVACSWLVCLALCPAAATQAAEIMAGPPSARLVPSEAAYYAVSLNNRQQWESLVESNAWARVRSMPIVQQLSRLVVARALEAAGPLGDLRQSLAVEDGERLLALGAEL